MSRLWAVAAVGVVAGAAVGETVTIPGDYDDLVEAVEHAADGSTVVIEGGTHRIAGPARVHGKSLVIRGQNGVVIDGSLLDRGGPMVRVSGDDRRRGSIVIEGVTFTGGGNERASVAGNRATGGAVFAEHSDVTLRGCAFRQNVALYGGAVGTVGGGLLIEGCAFETNSARGDGGAVSVLDAERVAIVSSVFSGNQADARGGAVAVSGRGSRLDVGSGRFVANRSAVGGGAVFLDRDVVTTLTRGVFAGNGTAGDGGAIWRVGGELELGLSSFAGNAARRGGVLATDGGGRVAVRSVTAVRNRAATGGDVYAGGSPLIEVFNALLWSGAEPVAGGAASTAKLSHSMVRGGWDGFGFGNLDGHPMLADVVGPDGVDGTGDENLRPRRGSPLVDAGKSEEAAGFSTDLGGARRAVHGPGHGYASLGGVREPRVDIGAYELQTGGPAGSVVDLAAPFGVLDAADVRAALDLLQAGDDRVDIAAPFGVVDAMDAAEVIGLLSE